MVQVVGLDPGLDEGAHQLAHHLRRVVDALQQHGLAEHGQTGIDDPGAGGPGVGRQFPGVVGVQGDIDGLAGAGEGGHQGRGDLLRCHHRNAGVVTHDPHMRDGGQPVGQVAQPPGRQDQRVAAGDDHLPDARGPGDVVQRRLQRRPVQVAVPVGPHHLPPEAEAAIDGTGVGDLQKHPVRIAVDDARHRAEGVVPHRVGGLVRQGDQLPRVGQELGGHGIGGIGRIDQCRHGRGDGHGIARGHRVQRGHPVLRHQPGRRQVGRGPKGAQPRQDRSAHRGTGDHRTSSICRAPVASRASRSKPRAAPEAAGMVASAASRSSSRG